MEVVCRRGQNEPKQPIFNVQKNWKTPTKAALSSFLWVGPLQHRCFLHLLMLSLASKPKQVVARSFFGEKFSLSRALEKRESLSRGRKHRAAACKRLVQQSRTI
eukprot:1104911-Amphidinium_carterae.1